MTKKTFRNVGIITFAFSLILIFSKHLFDNVLLNTLSDYGKSFAILGGGIIGSTIFTKTESKEEESKKVNSNFYLKFTIGFAVGIVIYHLINYLYTIYLK